MDQTQEDKSGQSAAFVSALTTEHFVLQTATSTTYTEAAARSSLYVMALSSSLVATGFMASNPARRLPFAAVVLPVLFLLGIFTVVRLVETSLESMHYQVGIARIRAMYRSLGPEAPRYFSKESGRWPEAPSPAVRFGPILAFFGTTASMIAVINNVVGGAFAALMVNVLAPSLSRWAGVGVGIAVALAMTWAFYLYQRWRFADVDEAAVID